MGDYTLERFLLSIIIFILLILLMILRGKRKIIIGLIIIVLFGYGVFFYIRGQVYEHQYKRSVEIVNEYLEKKYSNEEWIVNDTLEEGRKRKKNNVDIIFLNEEEVIYSYKVINENKVVQWSIYSGGKNSDDLLHYELEK